MRVERIETHEDSFARRRRDASGRLHRLLRKTIAIPGDDTEMRYVDVKPADCALAPLAGSNTSTGSRTARAEQAQTDRA